LNLHFESLPLNVVIAVILACILMGSFTFFLLLKKFGDASALHVVIFDEMDAIARRRGSLSGDTTGVRDSVVNQLLAKMDGVVEASNVLV